MSWWNPFDDEDKVVSLPAYPRGSTPRPVAGGPRGARPQPPSGRRRTNVSAAPVRPYQGPPAPASFYGTGNDGRGYSYGGPKVRPSEEYLADAYANQAIPNQESYDPFADLASIISGMQSGGRGSGGGGRPSNPDPLGWNAIAREQALREAYANMGGAIDTGAQAQLDALTGRRTQTTEAGVNARKRMDDAIANLGTVSGQTAGAVGQAYDAAGANIDQVLAQYAAQQQALGQGAQRTLGAFGVGPEELGVLGPSLQQQLGTYRGALGALGGVAQADLAQRPQAYAAMSADTMARLSAQEQQALAQIAAEEAAIKSQQARDRAQLGLQMYPQLFGIQDAEIARRQGYA